MPHSHFLSLRENAGLTQSDTGQLRLHYRSWSATLTHVGAGTRAALLRLGESGEYEANLKEAVLGADGASAVVQFLSLLKRLDRWCLLRRSAESQGVRLATLASISPSFEYASRTVVHNRPYVLSRFAHSRVLSGELTIESPISHARVTFHDWRAAALFHEFSRPRDPNDLEGKIPGLTMEGAEQVMTLMINARLLSELNISGLPVEDDSPSLESWEFHDLLFHSRSRKGRHDHPVGGTFRLAGRLEPPRALRASVDGEVRELHRPELDGLERGDPPFAFVQETRRSIREYDAVPITARQLGEFLFRVGRVTDFSQHEVPTQSGPVRMEFAHRPYPGGGGLYELELYVVVNLCADLAPGLYHYDPQNHRLEKISARTESVDELLRQGGRSANIAGDALQLLIVLTACFQRLSWKYESIAYSMILKDVGVVQQTMYLAATAMGLAPCGLGCGDSDLFSRAAGTDYYAETSVGEFLLGSKVSGAYRTTD